MDKKSVFQWAYGYCAKTIKTLSQQLGSSQLLFKLNKHIQSEKILLQYTNSTAPEHKLSKQPITVQKTNAFRHVDLVKRTRSSSNYL